jgi:cellulose synthase/poly-beta-1,6-N-acetylglucosamine synthase-like glycosyltransferase
MKKGRNTMAITSRKKDQQAKSGAILEGAEYTEPPRVAFLFDLDGTLVDSVYQHVLAWREALEKARIDSPSGAFTGESA